MKFLPAILAAASLAFTALPCLSAEDAAEKSPIVSPAISTENSPAAIKAAAARGAESANRDIKAGNLRILYYGMPWSLGKPLIDDDTGYRVLIVEGCSVTETFSAEVNAYNDTMREWFSRQAKIPKSK